MLHHLNTFVTELESKLPTAEVALLRKGWVPSFGKGQNHLNQSTDEHITKMASDWIGFVNKYPAESSYFVVFATLVNQAQTEADIVTDLSLAID